MVPLALFSSLVPLVERQALGDGLLKVQPASPLQSPQNRFGSGWGKPQFPSLINLSTQLCDLVDVDSWFTVFRLQIDSSFLHLPVTEWDTNDAYMYSAENVKAINVVNDAAERGVKLATDFVDTARSDKHFQNILQVVENDRKNNPNLRAVKKNWTKNWYWMSLISDHSDYKLIRDTLTWMFFVWQLLCSDTIVTFKIQIVKNFLITSLFLQSAFNDYTISWHLQDPPEMV